MRRCRESHIDPSPANAGSVAAWEVADLKKAVDELTANGVRFEHCNTDRLKTDDKGIAELGDERVAWFKDPDGKHLRRRQALTPRGLQNALTSDECVTAIFAD